MPVCGMVTSSPSIETSSAPTKALAAAALLAGTGLVSAQNAAKDQGGAAPAKGATPSVSTQSPSAATQPMKGGNVAQDKSNAGGSEHSIAPSDQNAKDGKTPGPSTAQSGAS